MSHEWNCVCVRCERLRDWLDAVDDEDSPPDGAATETQPESPSDGHFAATVLPGASYAD